MYISGDSISIQEIYSIAMTCICRIWSVHTVYRHRSSQRCSWVSCVSTRGPRAWMHGSLAAARRRSLPLTIAAARRTLARLARRSLLLAAARCYSPPLAAHSPLPLARCALPLSRCALVAVARSLPLAARSLAARCRCWCKHVVGGGREGACVRARSVHMWAERGDAESLL